MTNRLIHAGSKHYQEMINSEWDIVDDYYLISPYNKEDRKAVNKTIAMVQVIRNDNISRRQVCAEPSLTYENLMAIHEERLASLNISLCRKCFMAIKLEKGEYCIKCKTQ